MNTITLQHGMKIIMSAFTEKEDNVRMYKNDINIDKHHKHRKYVL